MSVSLSPFDLFFFGQVLLVFLILFPSPYLSSRVTLFFDPFFFGFNPPRIESVSLSSQSREEEKRTRERERERERERREREKKIKSVSLSPLKQRGGKRKERGGASKRRGGKRERGREGNGGWGGGIEGDGFRV